MFIWITSEPIKIFKQHTNREASAQQIFKMYLKSITKLTRYNYKNNPHD